MRHLPRVRILLSLACLAVALRPAPAAAQSGPPADSLRARVERDSLDPQTHYEAALALLRERRYDEAESGFRRAVVLDPRHASARLGIAVAQDRNRDYWRDLRRQGGDSAVAREARAREAEYRQAFLIDPFADPRPLLLADRRMDPGDIPAGLEAAYQHFLRIEAYEAGRHRLPVSDSLPPGLLWLHGLLAAHSGHVTHAIVDINALVRVAQSREGRDTLRAVPLRTNDFRYVLGALFARNRDRIRAIATFREVLAHDVGNYMANVRLAEVHEAGAEWSQAVNARRAAVAANPDDPTLVIDLAGTLASAGFHARAESLLVETEAVRPRDPRLHYLLGQVRQAQAKHGPARAAYETFLTLAPSRWTQEIADARQRLAQLP